MILSNKKCIQEECHLERLNKVIDNINNINRRDTLFWGTSIVKNASIPRQEKPSYLKTTTLESVPTVFAN